MTFNFDMQLKRGEESEAFLDAFFSERFEVRPVSAQEQRSGLDRFFVDRATGARRSVEYKTDWRAAETHNAFVETVSVDSHEKPGWVHTCSADLLFYYVPGEELVYVFVPSELRRLLPEWELRYPTRKAKNEGYWTHGVCVPLAEFERHVLEVVSL